MRRLGLRGSRNRRGCRSGGWSSSGRRRYGIVPGVESVRKTLYLGLAKKLVGAGEVAGGEVANIVLSQKYVNYVQKERVGRQAVRLPPSRRRTCPLLGTDSIRAFASAAVSPVNGAMNPSTYMST